MERGSLVWHLVALGPCGSLGGLPVLADPGVFGEGEGTGGKFAFDPLLKDLGQKSIKSQSSFPLQSKNKVMHGLQSLQVQVGAFADTFTYSSRTRAATIECL